jgi:hypothetical protein
MYVYGFLDISSPSSLLYEGAKKTPVTCVYCRSPWAIPATNAASAGGGSTSHEGYLNMSGAVGISGIRDTSTCESCSSRFTIMGGIYYVLDYNETPRYRQYRNYGCRSYY